MRGQTKVRATHLDRTAVIYVRQSTLAQVREHTESTMRQYALAEEATRLGWAADAVEVIDADLGVSGRSVEGRDGFKALVARVCLGEIGAVFGLEISRLARSSAELVPDAGAGSRSPTPWSSTPTGSTTWPTSTTVCSIAVAAAPPITVEPDIVAAATGLTAAAVATPNPENACAAARTTITRR